MLKIAVKEFASILNDQMIKIQGSFEKKDYETIKSEAHAIKGGAANFWATPLSDAAKAVELCCKDKDYGKLGMKLQTLYRELSILKDYLVKNGILAK